MCCADFVLMHFQNTTEKKVFTTNLIGMDHACVSKALKQHLNSLSKFMPIPRMLEKKMHAHLPYGILNKLDSLRP